MEGTVAQRVMAVQRRSHGTRLPAAAASGGAETGDVIASEFTVIENPSYGDANDDQTLVALRNV